MDNAPEETLDPEDWSAVRALAHRMIDDSIDRLASLRDRPVWQQMPAETEAAFNTPLPVVPTPLAKVYDEITARLTPHAMGNVHPRFWGWYMGAGNFTGALGDFLAAADGSNLGGGNTGPARVEMQVVDWMKEMMGFPASASGTLTSGGSLANMVALTVARNAHAGSDVRADGVCDMPRPLRFYVSDQGHSCHQKALETLGLGARSLRLIPTDAEFRMDIAALERAIAEDRAAGHNPACVIGTAGTTNSGAFDDLAAIAGMCRRDAMWFHVDGCIGAFLKLSDTHRHLVDGLEDADSVALDPHKWLHAPFESGCVLVRDERRHHATFEMHGDYLQMQTRGLLAGRFLADYGFELSRGYKALKIWMSLKEQGAAKFGRLIDMNIAQAGHLLRRVQAEDELEPVAPGPVNIVCFRYRGDLSDEAEIKARNTEIMLRLQESGLAVASDTTIAGRHCLRVAINNHRTRRHDLDLFVDAVLDTGRELGLAPAKAPTAS